jgi:uncharacterized damage-inducible protein DinB
MEVSHCAVRLAAERWWQAHAGERRIKSFQSNPVRWMAYLISHESHHRGQIALALKQSGMRLPKRVAIKAMWQQWYWGKE